jgi:quercetin 2,3-dioxygenase
MVAKVILHKDQLFKESYGGAIKERKVLGFPQEKGPLDPYSNIFYWSHLNSDYGCVVPQHPHIGFEILTYVLKGSYETFLEDQKEWIRMNEGDISVIHAGKGVRHSEKLLPHSEVLQIWLDPNFDQFKKNEPGFYHIDAASFPFCQYEERYVWTLVGQNSPCKLHSKEVLIEVHEFNAGFHTLTGQEDTVMSGFILDGYIDIDGMTLGRNDFFKVNGYRKKIKIASLVNSKVFITTSPLEPEYQTFAVSRLY